MARAISRSQENILDNSNKDETGFEAMALSEPVARALSELGFTEPTEVQRVTYPIVKNNRDLLIQSRTGTGKTAAFGIPIINDVVVPEEKKLQALIVAPTRELASQSAHVLGSLGKYLEVDVLPVYGGVKFGGQVSRLEEGAQVVSGTPGRILDHIRRGTMDVSSVRMLVLDEADEMLSMGFIEDILQIAEALPKERQTLLFSATIDDDIQRVSKNITKDPELVSLSSDSVGAQGIKHEVYFVAGQRKIGELTAVLDIENPETAVIFCNTKVQTERVAKELREQGHKADWLNGDLPQNEREKTLDSTRSGRIRYLVATDVAARGIDISHLTHVVNFDFPESADQYVHRTGRTGRAGRTGVAISLVSPRDLGALYYLRLLHRISPIERSLPSSGDKLTRKEEDRVELLRQGFLGRPSTTDIAVSQRLLTYEDADVVVANLVAQFFGTSTDVDEQAEAARKEGKPPTQVGASKPRPTAGASNTKTASGKNSPAKGGANSPSKPRPRRKEDASSHMTKPQVRESRQAASSSKKASEKAATPRSNQSTEVSSDAPVRETRRIPRRPKESSKKEETSSADLEGAVMLYINLGRRDGVDKGELTSLLMKNGLKEESSIKRVRVRDRYTFADLSEPGATEVVEKLNGAQAFGKSCVVERAKTA